MGDGATRPLYCCHYERSHRRGNEMPQSFEKVSNVLRSLAEHGKIKEHSVTYTQGGSVRFVIPTVDQHHGAKMTLLQAEAFIYGVLSQLAAEDLREIMKDV